MKGNINIEKLSKLGMGFAAFYAAAYALKSANVKLNRSNTNKLTELAGVIQLSTTRYGDLGIEEKADIDSRFKKQQLRNGRIMRKLLLVIEEWWSKRDYSMPYLIDIISKY